VNAGLKASSSLRAAGGDSQQERIIGRADQEIERRIAALNALVARITAAVRVSADEKAQIEADARTQIQNLTSLKAKIDAGTDPTVLRTDVQSITGSYRIFALVMPKGAILAAADRIKTIVGSMTAISAKLEARIDAVADAGANVSATENSLSDMKAKLADAKVQAEAAIDLVADLSVDNGDKTKAEANRQALMDARTKIRVGMEDLRVARKDAGEIVNALKALHVNATSSTSVSASSSDQ
jgi:predicted  nucleic acid-binding Zn-ribbon protein